MATTLGKRSLATAESISTVVPAIFSSSSSASSSSVTSSPSPSNTDFTAYVSPADLHPVAPFFKPPQQCDKKCKTESLKHDEEVADIRECMRADAERRRNNEWSGMVCPLSMDEAIVPLYSRCSNGGVHDEVQSSEGVSCSRCGMVLERDVLQDDLGLTVYEKEAASQRRALQPGTERSELAKAREAELKEAKKFVIDKESKADRLARDAVDAVVKPASLDLDFKATLAIIEETKRVHSRSANRQLPWNVAAAAAFIMCRAKKEGNELVLPPAKLQLPGLPARQLERAKRIVRELNPEQRLREPDEDFISRVRLACSEYIDGREKPVTESDFGSRIVAFSMFVENASRKDGKDATARALLDEAFACADYEEEVAKLINLTFKYLLDVRRRTVAGARIDWNEEFKTIDTDIEWNLETDTKDVPKKRSWLRGVLHCLSSQTFIRPYEEFTQAIRVLERFASRS